MTDNRVVIGCWGKKAYATMSGAWTQLRRLQRRHVLRCEKGRRLEPYRCTSCQQFHLGSTWLLDTRQRSAGRSRQRSTKDLTMAARDPITNPAANGSGSPKRPDADRNKSLSSNGPAYTPSGGNGAPKPSDPYKGK